MKIENLAALMGKTIEELEEELKNNDVIELRLTERNKTEAKDNGSIKVLE